jgi:26S proteasome regulatory subunit N12
MVFAGDILEIGAFYSIRVKDIPSFDRYFSQLQTFYSDYHGVLPPSPRQYPLQGLNLIRLLTQNRISDFHTTLESLPPETLQENPFIRHPVNLERWLMEGSYSKVWNAREEAPAAEYKFFVDSLMGTIRCVSPISKHSSIDDGRRNEIASCEEAAYNSLPMADAETLLFFNNQQDLMLFTQKVGPSSPSRLHTDPDFHSVVGNLISFVAYSRFPQKQMTRRLRSRHGRS